MAVADVIDRALAEQDAFTWPAKKYQTDPVGFAREILGVEPHGWQVEFLEAIRDERRVTVTGGRKIGKDFTAGVALLWWYASFDDARSIFTAPTARQVNHILWRQIRQLHAHAGRCLACKKKNPQGPRPCPHSQILDGRIGELASTGLKADDGREIRGETAKEGEGAAGTSGGRLLVLFDEASAISDTIYTAWRGNLASGQSREASISNPTRNEGFFFDSHNSKSELYRTMQVSSLESPNVIAKRDVVPGMASFEWVEEAKLEWGSLDSEGEFTPGPFYRVHVLGEFVTNEEGKILSLDTISRAEARWDETEAVGRLCIGIDPAGSGIGGDESVFVTRRGPKATKIFAFRGLTDDAHLAHLLGILEDQKRERERPVPLVIVDREGPIGATVYGILRGAAEKNGFEVLGVRSSERAQRQADRFERVRDELWWNLADWIASGGAIPSDMKLARELHAPSWEESINGKAKCTAKTDLRKLLDRSPDRADALALACWKHSTYSQTLQETAARQPARSVYDPPTQISAYEIDGAGTDNDPVYGR